MERDQLYRRTVEDQTTAIEIVCPRFADMQDACVLICCFFHFFLEGTVHTHV